MSAELMRRSQVRGVWSVIGVVSFWIVVVAGFMWVMGMVGCAGQATSDITGAKADVSDRTLSVSAPSKRRMRMTITSPAPVGFEAVAPEEGEDK